MMMQSNKISIFALLSVSLLLVGGTAGNVFAITITPDTDPTALVNNILGGGITIVGDAILIGTSESCTPTGTFTDGIASGLGIADGIVLTSGEVTLIDNNNSDDASTCVAGNPGDPMLDVLAGLTTFDATVLEFVFQFGDGSVGGDLFFTFQFASEEYNEFVNSAFNDVFGLFVDGVNIAEIPGSGGIPVAINTVNCDNPFNPPSGSFCNLFNNNDLQDGGPFFNFEYDGFTDVFQADALNLSPGLHTMQFKIADTSDEVLDSGVFIQAESFSDKPQPTAEIDIKPTSCPNPINTKSKGVLPVAVLGTDTFDVNEVDVSTIQLEGVAPIRSSIEDVATPFGGDLDNELSCTEDGADGFLDLTLKFKTQDIINAISPVADGDILVLELTGDLLDGTTFASQDIVIIRDKGKP